MPSTKIDWTGTGRFRAWFVCVALVIGTALLYAPVLSFDYVSLDDPLYFDNHINRGFSWGSLWWCFTTTCGYLWHPLTWVSHMLDCQFFDARFGWHHATNVVFHISSSVLLFFVLNRMTNAFWRSAMVAALFAWHPMHVESVAWIAERKDVLSTFFWMLATWAYIRYAEESKTQRKSAGGFNRKRTIFYVLALVFFVMGLMVKPMLVTLPFVFLLLDWWPLRRYNSDAAKLAKAKTGADFKLILALVAEKIPFCLISVVFCVLTIVAAGSHALSLASLPLSERLGNSVVSYFLYVAKMIWPVNMVVLYPFEFQWPTWQIAGACLLILLISLAALSLKKSRPYLLFGWMWFLGILVPVIGLVQVGAQPMADRYTYVPSIGLFIMLCWGGWDLLGVRRYGGMALGMLAWVSLLGCVLVTGRQLQFWRNSDTLFTHNLELAPNNYIVHANYAAYFYDEKQPTRSVDEAQKSLRLRPDFALAHCVLGNALLQEGNSHEATTQLEIALKIDPSSENARLGYAKALLGENRAGDAAQQINQVLAGDPDSPEASCVLGKALLKQGNLTEAAAQFTKAMSLVEKYPDAEFHLALILARQGRMDEAVAHYREAKDVPADAAESLVMNNLAWILATNPRAEYRDGAAAVALATRARDLDRSQQPVFIGTLAAAYAEAGRFDEAVAAAQQAHDLALKAAGEAHGAAERKAAQDLAARNLELLEIYRSHKAYHETLDFKP